MEFEDKDKELRESEHKLRESIDYLEKALVKSMIADQLDLIIYRLKFVSVENGIEELEKLQQSLRFNLGDKQNE